MMSAISPAAANNQHLKNLNRVQDQRYVPKPRFGRKPPNRTKNVKKLSITMNRNAHRRTKTTFWISAMSKHPTHVWRRWDLLELGEQFPNWKMNIRSLILLVDSEWYTPRKEEEMIKDNLCMVKWLIQNEKIRNLCGLEIGSKQGRSSAVLPIPPPSSDQTLCEKSTEM